MSSDKTQPYAQVNHIAILFVGPILGKQPGWVVSAAESLANQLDELGYTCHLTSRKLNRYARLFDILWTIVRLYRTYPIMNLQVFGGPSFVVEDLASLLARRLGMRIVMVLRGGGMPDFMRRYPKWSSRVLSRAHKIVTPSNFLADAIRPYGFQALIIPNAIRLKDYPCQIRKSVHPNLLWMRTFHEIYNPEMAIETLAQLIADYPNATLTMAGQEKGLLSAVKRLAQDKHLESHLRFVGFMNLSDKQREFPEHDIFINTNRVDNMPTSVVEAAAFGMPIVATSVGGVPYLIRDGENGLLVPNEDSKAMALAVKRVIEELGLAERLSRNARSLGESHDWSKVLPQWEQLFKEILMK